MSFAMVDRCPTPGTSFWERTGDGQVTISDLWHLVGDVLHLPGDVVIALILKDNEVSSFFETTCQALGGGWSTGISLFAWLSFVVGSWNIIDDLRTNATNW